MESKQAATLARAITRGSLVDMDAINGQTLALTPDDFEELYRFIGLTFVDWFFSDVRIKLAFVGNVLGVYDDEQRGVRNGK